jgi:hypothetical protein
VYSFIEHLKIFDSTSLAASINSDAVKLKTATRYSIHLVITGSPVGSFRVQASNIPVAEGSTVPDWSDVAYSTIQVSDNRTVFYNVNDVAYYYFRVVYTRTSGTGTVTGHVVIKG